MSDSTTNSNYPAAPDAPNVLVTDPTQLAAQAEQLAQCRAKFIARFEESGILSDPKDLAILADIDETQSPREVFARRKAVNPSYSVSNLVSDLVSIIWDLSFHIEAEQIWREVDAKTPEQIDAELRAAGIDPKAAADKAWEKLQELIKTAGEERAKQDGTGEEATP
jgi:hypothetical protein